MERRKTQGGKHRKTLTMNWEGLDDDDDDQFFESYNRLSCAVQDNASSSDEDEDYDDPRMSFASAVSSAHSRGYRSKPGPLSVMADTNSSFSDYSMWMAAPVSISERRKRLLQGMGLDDNRESIRGRSHHLRHAISKRFGKGHKPNSNSRDIDRQTGNFPCSSVSSVPVKQKTEKTEHSSVRFVLVRSRSEGDIDSFSMEKSRKEELIGKVSKQRLTRTSTKIAEPRAKVIGTRVVMKDSNDADRRKSTPMFDDPGVGAFFLIKNLDTGKEFIVNECGENGAWNRLSDLQTGKQLTMEEFERTVGHSRLVNEAMRRANVTKNDGYSRKLASSSSISRSLKGSKRRGAAFLKNIKGVASGIIGEREGITPMEGKSGKNKWVKVRQSGKSYKELSALHMSQEIQAHEGCIWTIKFSLDGHYLASAGEDRVIHVWEVQECEILSMRPEEANLTPIHPSLLSTPDRYGLVESPLVSYEKKKKGRFGSKRGNIIPEYVHVPETVFSLSDKPYCSFEGHSDDVLDVSWSKSCQLLLSSSMDKSVRLWDVESKACLKMFAHNDYVTCVQFNPMDDDYFISGSLDAKVRIWNIPHRHVVDWIDVHEMVTAISYTPDGQGVFVGTHKGSCRTYTAEDCKLSQAGTISIRHKKKSHLRKITGFQFGQGNPSEVLVTSADSRIRILDGSTVVQKYRGFRNASSQIAASFSPDGRYIICASEDSHVYVWKHEEHRSASSGKGKNIIVTRSHEQFHCKDVSVAISWPFLVRGDPPPVSVQHSKRHSKRFQAPCAYVDENTGFANSKRMIPPIPKKIYNHGTEDEDHAAISNIESELGDSFANSKRMLPPHHPKKNDFNEEEEHDAVSRSYSGSGDSFNSGRYGDSPSASPSPSWCSSSDSNYSSSTLHPSAWGLVIVTAGFGGEIKCYQNFGLPRRMRPANLFGSPAL